MEFHISRFDPLPYWPHGGWSVYKITGDEIADRIRRDAVTGEVVRRDSWCGYLGIAQTVEELAELIRANSEPATGE